MAMSDQRASQPSLEAGAGYELGGLLRQGVTLQSNRVGLLTDGLTKGMAFFDSYNDSRVKLAFTYFDQPMREAFYEILYLLHTNTPELAKLKALPAGEKSPSKNEYAEPFNLYVEGCPSGVAGLERLSKVYRDDFAAYIKKVFNAQIAPANGKMTPVVTLQSIGSIGTVGHKSNDSDLDLQVIYNLTPPLPDATNWGNADFLKAMRDECAWWISKLPAMQKLTPDKAAEPAVQQQIRAKAEQTVATNYPSLYA